MTRLHGLLRAFKSIWRRPHSLLVALALTQPVVAEEPLSFRADSLAAIEARHAGRPFILSLWSVNWCGHCIAELSMLGRLAKSEKRLPLVLVATDAPEFSNAIESTLQRLGLADKESWVFDDDIPERLRHAIDASWRGEVPRTYLYDARHRRETVSGLLDESALIAWLKRQP